MTLRALAALLILACAACAAAPPGAADPVWVGVWASSQQVPEPHNAVPAQFVRDVTLRQTVRVTAPGARIRIRVSNVFGAAPLAVAAAHVARAAAPGSPHILAGADAALTFSGASAITIPAGAEMISDPVALPVRAFDDLAVSLHLPLVPAAQTGHPGSRTTSHFAPSAQAAAQTLLGAEPVDHWYFLSGVEAEAAPGAQAVIVLGDSITDGRGSTTNGNDRWTDFLAREFQSSPATRHLSVLNHGLGGNRVLEDGLGPNALSRIDRDVIAQPGAAALIVLEGVNDLGALGGDAPASDLMALADRLIAAYDQIARRARAHGIAVYGGTILPYGGSQTYTATPESEAARARVNDWIRASGAFDGVIDFDVALRDPADPSRLRADYDSGDRLHPSPAGFAAMARAAAQVLAESR